MTPDLDSLLRQHGLSAAVPPGPGAWAAFLGALAAQRWPGAPAPAPAPEQQSVTIVTDPAGRIGALCPVSAALLGASALGTPLETHLSAALEGLRLRGLLERAGAGETLRTVLGLRGQDGGVRAWACTLTRLEGPPNKHLLLSGELSGAPGAELLAPQVFYEELLCALPAPVTVLDAQRRYLFCNPAAIASPEVRRWIVGRTDAEYVAHRNFAPELAQAREYHYLQAQQSRDTVFWEERLGTPARTVQLRSLTPVFAEGSEPTLYIGHGMDITELRRTQDALSQLNDELEDRVQSRTAQLRTVTRQLRHEASHDALTGLPNRTLFSERLDTALVRSRGPGAENFAVLFLDTDRFKGVNDTLGHPAGDTLLRELSARLLAALRPGDTLARLGGDEFAVLLTPLDRPEDATEAALRLQAALRPPLRLHGLDIALSVSIGVVLAHPEYASAADILRDADIAMYRAKHGGGAGHQVFTPQMREHSMRIGRLENELKRGLGRDELRVVYQPIMALGEGRVVGFEALLRWQHPEHGLLEPGAFLDVAEDCGLMLDIDRWVLREACVQLRRWQQESPHAPPLTLNVNFSARHFAAPGVYEQVRGVLADTGFPPARLNLEITESALLARPEAIGQTLEQLRALGVRLHLDDFGTGYSSLGYLHAYPLDTLKIDRSFVQGMLTSPSSAELVRTIIAMAKNMKMRVVAEGIEETRHLDALRGLGCDYGQGYLFARPLGAEEARAFARAH
ncbi:putative bifunctional diguanylate cyclase/phosphodiesterase [Deinococcus petrolearius]|uniref:Bifunctional diguanylate cyclase/phosphodiesterase n=1 Tax=Deinococcus petrolearius TaxID=1751295 RepID=A0ABW1DGY9_9DEIO